MGASNSKSEEDKGLQLCRARKKFIKQALNGRCSLAAAHITYIEELKIIGSALRKFVEIDAQVESFVYPSTSVTSEPHLFTEKSTSHLSASSRSLGQHVDSAAHVSPSPSPTVSTKYQTHYMKFRSTFSKKVEEKPPTPVTVSVISTTPLSTTPRSTEAPEFETPFNPPETPESETPLNPPETPWDYFGLFHPIDSHFSQGRGFDQVSENSDDIRHLMEEERDSGVENVEEKTPSRRTEESQESEDEFDEPPSLATLVRSFKNVNRDAESTDDGGKCESPKRSSDSRVSETNFSTFENVVNSDSVIGPSESVVSETKSVIEKKNNSPNLSPLRASSSRFVQLNNVKVTPMKESEVEEKAVPQNFYASMKDIEQLFIKASDSGKEVPRMLEANKLHFRPVSTGKERGSLLKSCFSCGEDPTEVQQEPPHDSVKYLTWHRTTSSRSASSRNLLGANSINDVENHKNNLFDNSCMVSGSHASTLDRLYAWEKKLYDEVKAAQVLKSNFDHKCTLLRQKESRGESTDKTRAVVKDLHSRIRVAIHRIDSISKKIEEIRDKELQPQLEELIEGLRKMWEKILEYHKLQFHIISISHAPGNTKITIQSDSQRQITIHLGNELNSFISSFTKWIGAQKIYVEAIDKWLFKCVSLPQNKSKRNKRMKPPPIRNIGPPIYMICGAWLDMIENLGSKGVVDSVKDLEGVVAQFLPRQEKNQGKARNPNSSLLGEEASEESVPALDHFRTSLAGFLGQLSNFAEACVEKFGELQKNIQEAKNNYEQFKSQQ